MSVSGVSMTEAALLQSALKISGSGSGSDTPETFGSLLSNALTGMQNACGAGAYQETYDLYSELLEQSHDSTRALIAAMMGAGSGSATSMMLLRLFGALTGELSTPCTGTAISAAFETDTAPAGTGNVTASPWIEADPAMISNACNRSAELYRAVIDQFDVETNPRYSTEQGGTYCNIFVWDVTSAMGAEIPHYYNAETGEPMERGDEGASQMTANRMYAWLHENGEEYGWHEVTAEEAQELANHGHPAVTALYRTGRHGHVQMVCPSEDGEYNGEKGVTIAQAGRNLTSYTYITNIYNASLSKVSYFAHI